MQEYRVVGSIGEMACSPRLQQNIGLGLASNEVAHDKDKFSVMIGRANGAVTIAQLPFIR